MPCGACRDRLWPGGLPKQPDRETLLLALKLAHEYLTSLIDAETVNGEIAPRRPGDVVGPAEIRRWQRQKKRIEGALQCLLNRKRNPRNL